QFLESLYLGTGISIMKILTSSVVVVLVAALFGFAFHNDTKAKSKAGLPAAARKAVVVELFTSEGCSSCPPADAFLARLENEQPVENAEILALEEHVDYWNSQGWVDPFSSVAMTERQRGYAFALGTGSAYTPQMIVDGHEQFVGSREREALGTIEQAASR